jgi:hypothetical protein
MFNTTRKGQEVRNTKSNYVGIVIREFVNSDGAHIVHVYNVASGREARWNLDNVEFPG